MKARSPLHLSVRCALNACVSADSAECLRATLRWLDAANENNQILPSREIKLNSECMLRACRKCVPHSVRPQSIAERKTFPFLSRRGSFDLVHALYDAGFDVVSTLTGEK